MLKSLTKNIWQENEQSKWHVITTAIILCYNVKFNCTAKTAGSRGNSKINMAFWRQLGEITYLFVKFVNVNGSTFSTTIWLTLLAKYFSRYNYHDLRFDIICIIYNITHIL